MATLLDEKIFSPSADHFPFQTAALLQPPIPELACPFDWLEHPAAPIVAAASRRFIDDFALLPDAASRRKFLAMDFQRLGALAYPFASVAAATLATNWLVWLFAWDDDCDRTPMGRDPAEMRRRFSQYLDVFHRRPLPASVPPLVLALDHLVSRMFVAAGASWLAGFTRLVEDYFDSCLWESENRQRGEAPSLEEYLERRLTSGAVYTVFELFAMTSNTDLPAEVCKTPAMAELSRAANNIICWSNDLFSFKKEVARGDVHNLVILLMESRGLGAHQAMLAAADIHDQEIARYLVLESRLPAYGDQRDAQIASYCRQLRAWIAANYEWSLGTYRYHAPALEV